MKKQTIIWTALPNGITTEGKLKLSILVSPRLETDTGIVEPNTGMLNTTLGEFEDFLIWSEKNIDFKPGDPPVITPPPEQRLWEALFKPSTLVRNHKFDDYSNRNVQSIPVT